jgi:UDP-N-acetylmuramate--alanine ligase
VTSAIIFDRVRLKKKVLIGKEQLLEVLSGEKPELLLTLGAGDIDQFVEPIVNLYKKEKTT